MKAWKWMRSASSSRHRDGKGIMIICLKKFALNKDAIEGKRRTKDNDLLFRHAVEIF
jgi:hypothetical protein